MVIFQFIIIVSVFIYDYIESSKLVFGWVGETVHLPCKYDIGSHGILNVCWGRHQSWFTCENTLISTDGLNVNYRQSQRFSLAGELNQGNVSLTINRAKEEDAGLYVCRVEIPGLFNDVGHNVYLFIRNGRNHKKATQSPSTMAKQEKQVYYVSDPFQLITEEYIRSESTTAADINMGKAIAVVHKEETLETFIINAVRVGAIVFIPGLIIALLFRLRRSTQQSRSRGIITLMPSDQHTHSMNVEGISHH